MTRSFLLCAIFAFASVQAPCTCKNDEDRKQLKINQEFLIKKHNAWFKDYKRSLSNSYEQATTKLKNTMQLMMEVDYLPEKLNVPKNVNIEHCLKEFSDQMNILYDNVVNSIVFCANYYMNAAAFQNVERELRYIRTELYTLDQSCIARNVTTSVICLTILKERFQKVSSEYESIQRQLMAEKSLAVHHYRKNFAEKLEGMKLEWYHYEEDAKKCIKAAIAAQRANRRS